MSRKVVFVYGTLRPGWYNFDLLQPAVVAQVEADCSIEGQLFHVLGGYADHPMFPVANLDLPGRIRGCLLVVETEVWTWDIVHRMELDAGYTEREVQVADESTSVRTTGERGFRHPEVTALAFHYPHRTGARIESGDWADVVARDS